MAQAGAALPATTKTITQGKLQAYAEAGGDHNPLHLDEAFAAATQFGGTIAHGLLVLAYVSEMLTAAFGEAWLASGKLKIRFRAPARPGDTVTTFGSVTSVADGRIACDIGCRNQDGEVLIDGTAEVTA
ncbi:MAG TPA: MaoC family dehydratase [Dehalococcoidia bacterium]|nr:MaoC family dehydratase [Dehalococcoidia bacterium]